MTPTLTVGAARLGTHVEPLDDLLTRALARIAAAEPTNVGFQRSTDLCYKKVAPFLKYMINNYGDPRTVGIYPAHAKDAELASLTYFAGLFEAPQGWSGYVTAGGTESTLYALALARIAHPGAVVYCSAAAHDSVRKVAGLLQLPVVVVGTLAHGEMDYLSLQRHAYRYRYRPAIVVCTIGTTSSEAVDNVPQARQALAAAGITAAWFHADAALAGPHLALCGRTDFCLRPGGADSIGTSSHKWYGTPVTGSVVLIGESPLDSDLVPSYVGSIDNTISSSRPGLTSICLYHGISQVARRGPDAHRLRALRARDLAADACRRLGEIGWPCWRVPDAITVMLRPLPGPLRQQWPMPRDGGWAHFVCTPGAQPKVERLINHLTTHLQKELIL